MEQQRRNRTFWRTFLLFAAGLAIGLLAAPKTGRGARTWMRQKADRLANNVSRIDDYLRRRASYEQGRLSGMVHEMRKLTGQAREEKYVDDDLITQRVRTAIGESPQTWDIPRINVDTANRIVTLRGVVESDQRKQALTGIAESAEDVEGVVNKVNVIRKAAG